MLLLLALAIGPALILLHVVWAADRHREPVWNVLTYVGAGAVILGLAAIVEGLLGVGTYLHAAGTHPWAFMASMFGIGLVEEGVKIVALAWRARRDPVLDEPFDWLVYAVAVSLGFATLENLFFVLHGGVAVGLARAFTSVPVHALCGTLMGTRLADAMRARNRAVARQARVLALVEPTLWHGTYDALCGFIVAGTNAAPWLLLALLASLWWQGYVRTHALRDANPSVPRPPILYPEVVLGRRGRDATHAEGDASGPRCATSLAAAMRGDIPADAPARRHPQATWFRRW